MSESVEIRWRKMGGGSLRFIRGKIIKPNEEFLARPDEIPTAFLRYVAPLDPLPDGVVIGAGRSSPTKGDVPAGDPKKIARKPRRRKSTEPVSIKSGVFEARKRDDGDEYDVVNTTTEKAINDAGLTKEKADQLVQELNA